MHQWAPRSMRTPIKKKRGTFMYNNRVHYFTDKYHFPGTREQDFAKNPKKNILLPYEYPFEK